MMGMRVKCLLLLLQLIEQVSGCRSIHIPTLTLGLLGRLRSDTGIDVNVSEDPKKNDYSFLLSYSPFFPSYYSLMTFLSFLSDDLTYEVTKDFCSKVPPRFHFRYYPNIPLLVGHPFELEHLRLRSFKLFLSRKKNYTR